MITVRTTIMVETTTATRDLLRVSQWLSPAFPVGGFAYSHGLDWTIAAGEISSCDQFSTWLSDVLAYGAGRSDAILLSLAHRSAHPDVELADLARSLAGSAERLRETSDQGRAFLRTTNALLGTDLHDLPLPVAVGAQARCLAIDTVALAALYLQAFAGNLTAIATRAVPLGQTEAQRALAAQSDLIVGLATECARSEAEDISVSAFRGDLASLRHETQEVRLFLT